MSTGKFEEIDLGKDSSLVGYWRQRNKDVTGYTVYVGQSVSITIKIEHLGGSTTEINMQKVDLDGLIDLLVTSRRRLEQNEIVERLKGKKT